ncbi:MAG: hypothetical protein LBC07_04685, partial [Elusimicrobiota bacterium]|nr:hypothetical protein [Elusimicrobiota bacterium]
QKNAFNLLAHIKKFYVQKNADGLYLCPTNPNVYISSGFEPFCYEKKIILNYDNKSSSKIRKANAADTNLLLELYNNFMVDKNGFCFRDEEYFKTVIKFMDFYIVYDRDKNLGYFATDGFYWELCADLKTLQGVKEMNAKEIFVPSLAQDENSVVSQMICAFNPLLKREIGKENINFDRYF